LQTFTTVPCKQRFAFGFTHNFKLTSGSDEGNNAFRERTKTRAVAAPTRTFLVKVSLSVSTSNPAFRSRLPRVLRPTGRKGLAVEGHDDGGDGFIG
jgi:hypothetical protein